MSPSTTNGESAGDDKGEMAGRLTLIRFPLLSQFSRGFDSILTAVLFQIFVGHDFTTNEFVLEVRACQRSGKRRSDDELEKHTG